MKGNFIYAVLYSVFALFLSACSNGQKEDQSTVITSASAKVAEAIYFGGDILTMNDQQSTAEAVAIKDGKIIGVGTRQQLSALTGANTKRIDLNGNTLMPGFIDSHSHLTMSAAKQAVVNLDPPPAGNADSITTIQQLLIQRLQESPPAVNEWLIGWGYDHVMLTEQRHPTRADLDKVSSQIPIILIHYSSHQVVVNSAGLLLAGITEATEDPAGGLILREPNSRTPNGILQESAMYPVVFPIINKLITGGMNLAADHTPTESALWRIEEAMDTYASQGFTTVTDMAVLPPGMKVLQALADKQRLKLDVIAIAPDKAYSSEQISQIYSPNYTNRFRIGGAKLILDGGSPGRSAYLLEPYHKQLPGEDKYRGYPHYPEQAKLNKLVEANVRAGNPLYIHALGDAAVSQAIEALQLVNKPTRTQLIHVQQATEKQLDQLASLGATVTFQVAHNFYFGDFHQLNTYGSKRSSRLNPAQSALNRGISVSIHHDSPVHPIDQMMLIWTAVNRTTRSGQVIGEDQRISVLDALKASTINAAYQFHEEQSKGSLEVGKLADMVILSDNPLTVNPMALNNIQVIETIKEGLSVFRRDAY